MLSVDQTPKLWDLEVLGISKQNFNKSQSEINEELINKFKGYIVVNSDGRFEVPLPWISEHPYLETNFNIAYSRLKSATNRLLKINKFKDYDFVFQEWARDGIIELVKEGGDDNTNVTHFLPHRPVIRETALKTKIRPVFDASAKGANNVSLNDCLCVGPNLLEDIPAILARFRVGVVGFTADIKQAFLMIAVSNLDRDALRFLWWKNGDPFKEIVVYRHTRVVFGVTSSPFILNLVLKSHLENDSYKKGSISETVLKLKKSFYCDDCVASVDSEEEFLKFKADAEKVLMDRKFELRGWIHNGMPVENGDHVRSVLGLQWDVTRDVLFCSRSSLDSLNQGVQMTKRGLLSVLSRIYDPCGFLSPALLVLKLLLQESWQRRLGWEEELSPDIKQSFMKWLRYLPELENCVIPRRVHHGVSSLLCCELHIFCDGSAKAYGCCVFLRCSYNGKISAHLVASKSRVGPIERCTIPRMELLGALIGARLGKSIIQALDTKLNVCYWTDSMIVLSWITNSLEWKTWVGNRVKEIRELTLVSDWRHVPGELNPADLPTRGCDLNTLKNENWFNGPDWLYFEKETWPFNKLKFCEEALNEQKRVITMVNIDNWFILSKLLGYFSQYNKIVRTIVYMFRFSYNCRNKNMKKYGVITGAEFKAAELVGFQLIQAEWSEEDRKKVATSVNMVKMDGLWRVNSRLIKGDDSDSFKYPVILPEHPLVFRLIENAHLMVKHAGVGITLGLLREQVWILKGRQLVRKVVNRCVRCKRFNSLPVCTPAAPLPKERFVGDSAFAVAGVDLAGPMFLKNRKKAWVVLFTCAVYRAVHLELVTSLSTEAFLQALRRFIGRRGRSAILWSDNGTNFVGAHSALKELDWDRIVNESSLQKIEWRFNPPAAPWWGGFWERMVGLVKTLIRKNLGRSFVTYEELQTIIVDCEFVLNNRPITYVYNDNDELEPLTPWKFLVNNISSSVKDIDEVDRKSLLKRVQYVQNIRNCLRKRFKNEYLGLLASPPGSARGEVKVGEIVLVKNENLKRTLWPLAKVIEAIHGKDGIVRSVRLKLQNGELLRPVQNIYRLEVRATESEESKCHTAEACPLENCLKLPEKCNNDIAEVGSGYIARSGRKICKPNKLNL